MLALQRRRPLSFSGAVCRAALLQRPNIGKLSFEICRQASEAAKSLLFEFLICRKPISRVAGRAVEAVEDCTAGWQPPYADPCELNSPFVDLLTRREDSVKKDAIKESNDIRSGRHAVNTVKSPFLSATLSFNGLHVSRLLREPRACSRRGDELSVAPRSTA